MAVSLIWLGAEIPSNKNLLLGADVTRLGVSFRGLDKRVFREMDEMLGNFPPDVEIHAHPGINRKNMTVKENIELAEQYEDFVSCNRDRLSTWTEFDADVLGPQWIEERRTEFYDQFDEQCFRPMWDYTRGAPELERLADRYPHVVISARSLEFVPGISGVLHTLRRKYETTFHVFGGNDLAAMNTPGAPPIDDVYTSAWTAGMRQGETVVWDNNRLMRYPKRMKEQARPKYRALIEKIGLDADKIIHDDKPAEVSKLAIWSLQQFEEHGTRTSVSLLADKRVEKEQAENTNLVPTATDNTPDDVRNANLIPVVERAPAERKVLPVVSVEVTTAVTEDEEGTKTFEDIPVVRSQPGNLRKCDTCFIATNCPEFKTNHECAFNFPVTIRTRDQEIALIQTVIESQSQRVMFGLMSEQVNGGYPDPTVSREMDRLMGQIKTKKDLEDNKEFFRLTMERQTSGGVLSAIFGSKATRALTQQPEE